jgi:hypothetical protein
MTSSLHNMQKMLNVSYFHARWKAEVTGKQRSPDPSKGHLVVSRQAFLDKGILSNKFERIAHPNVLNPLDILILWNVLVHKHNVPLYIVL